jgi:hypothetical protein
MTKFPFRVAGLVLGVLLCEGRLAEAQNVIKDPAVQPAPSAPHAQFFAGTVVELDSTHIKVTRTLVGRPTESRSFVIDAATKMNRSVIKVRNRVTVRYKRLPQGDVALEIQPRPVIARSPKI